jgi:hypothetical protein
MKTTIELTDVFNPNLTECPDQSKVIDRSSLATTWNRVWDALATQIIGRSEPTVRQTRDRAGYLSWHVYDPTTGYSAHFSSEQEVRIWLDRRYYF